MIIPCPKCGGPTEEWKQEGRSIPAIRCIKNGCIWHLESKYHQEYLKSKSLAEGKLT